jgi:hypothetical protein
MRTLGASKETQGKLSRSFCAKNATDRGRWALTRQGHLAGSKNATNLSSCRPHELFKPGFGV